MVSEKSPKQVRVLLADDSRVFLRAAQILLSEYYEVGIAYDGQEAIDKIRASPPDVFIVDLVLPKISGTQLIPQVKAEFPDMIIVALTAIDDEETVKEVLGLGAHHYLIKGALTGDEIYRTVERLLAKSKSSD
ncbi:MAG: response regulator transcription factor [Promethearchaeota archaeon]